MNTSTSNDNQDVRKALQHAVQTICAKVEEEEDEQAEEDDCHKMGAMTPSAILALTELTYQFATTALANDLSAFSSHANRKTITVEDVLLVVRKNPSIQQKLQQFCEEQQKKQPQRKKKQARPKKDVEVDSSSSDNESDKEDFSENMLVDTDTEKSPPAKAIGNFKKRARPIAKKPLAIRDDDDSSSASSSGNGSTPKTKKSNYFQTKKQQTAIDIEDSSTEEEEEESPEKKSEICALLETTITMASPDDDDDDSY